MRVANAGTAGLAGIAVVVAVGPFVPVTVGLTLGAVVAAAITLYADTDRYGLAGATMLLGVGTAILLLDWFPATWSRTPLVALWLFGLVSLTIVVARYLLGFVGRRVIAEFVPDENADSIWNALSAFGGTLVLAWTVITAQEKAARTGGVAIGGSSTMALDTLGYEVPVYVPFLHEQLSATVGGFEVAVPLWVLRNGIDATAIVFVGCLIVGFHTLGTFAAIWQAVKDTTGYATDKADEMSGADPAGAGGGDGGTAGDGPTDRTPSEHPPWADDGSGNRGGGQAQSGPSGEGSNPSGRTDGPDGPQ
jgi:hypothetical protein